MGDFAAKPDHKFASYEAALAFAIRVGTHAQPYRVYKKGDHWWCTRTTRRAAIPQGPFAAKLRYR